MRRCHIYSIVEILSFIIFTYYYHTDWPTNYYDTKLKRAASSEPNTALSTMLMINNYIFDHYYIFTRNNTIHY